MTTTRILAFALPVWLATAGFLLYRLFRPAMRVAAGPGEVAEAPERLPTKACPLNAAPHMCCDETLSDNEVIAAMEKQFPKTKTRRIR